MGSKGGSQTIGYKYFMSILMGFGRGAMSELVEIKVGEKTAWRGPECDHANGLIEINSPDLFGGDMKEGGIKGPAQILWGEPNQVLPGAQGSSVGTLPSIKEMISPGAPMPALRGVTTLWFDGEVCSINPYPKEWKMRVRRHVHGWYGGVAWYGAKAIIYLGGPEIVTHKRALQLGDGTTGSATYALFQAKGGSTKNAVILPVPGNIKAQNGAHIIYECVTNPEWGRGLTADLLDENAFTYAANQLCAEGFGLCFFWQRQEDVDAFIQIVLDHIGGELYTDRSTGLLTLRLIRNDYDIDTLPTFEPGRGLLEILNDDSGSQDIAFNEVVIKYHDPISNTDGEARAHNAGARIAQGSINSMTKDLPGLPTKELAARVAVRELIVQSSGLKKYKVRLDRSGWRIAPGMPFRIKCPQRGIASIVLRAGEVVDSSAQQGGDIQITAVEDVFSMPATGMVVPETPTWVSPSPDPVVPDASRIFEMSYYDLTQHLNQLALPNIDNEDAYFALVASQPLATQVLYDLMISPDDGVTYVSNGTFSFTGNATLAAPIGPLDTTLTLTTIEHFPDDVVGDSMMIGDERLRIDAWNPVTGEMTVARGVADTLPASHPAGDYIWLPDDDLSSDAVVYAPGEEITAAAATRSNSGVLTQEDFDPQTLTIVGRVGRPYPPANLQVDGVSIYLSTGQHAEPILTWVPRNRVTQEDQLVGHVEGPVVAEEGTTYRVDVKELDGTLLASYEVADALTFTYGATEQAADGNPSLVRFNVVALRGGQESLYAYDLPVVISGGWGYGWGFNYGGS